MTSQKSVYLFTNDLRVHDNPLWDSFIFAPGPKKVHVVLDPSFQGQRHNERIFEIFTGQSRELFSGIHKKWPDIPCSFIKNYSDLAGSHVFISEDTTPFARNRLNTIRALTTVTSKDIKHLLPEPDKKFKKYSSYFDSRLPLVQDSEKDFKTIRKIGKEEPIMTGLYKEALSVLNKFDPCKYLRCAKASVIARSGSTGASMYIARGILSPREVYNHVVKKKNPDATMSIFRELIFRDFYSRVTLWYLEDYGTILRNPGIKWKIDNYSDYIKKIKSGPPIIQEIYESLIKTGKVSNYGRMLFATWTYDISAPWKFGEFLFAKYLLDYDFCSNHWNWAHHSIQGLNYQWPNKKFKIPENEF